MADIMGDDQVYCSSNFFKKTTHFFRHLLFQWWRHTSRPTKYFYSEDLKHFYRVSCINVHNKIVSARLVTTQPTMGGMSSAGDSVSAFDITTAGSGRASKRRIRSLSSARDNLSFSASTPQHFNQHYASSMGGSFSGRELSHLQHHPSSLNTTVLLSCSSTEGEAPTTTTNALPLFGGSSEQNTSAYGIPEAGVPSTASNAPLKRMPSCASASGNSYSGTGGVSYATTPRSSIVHQATMLSSTSSAPPSIGISGMRGERVDLQKVFKVVRFYSFWKTCTSFHRIVTMIEKVVEEPKPPPPQDPQEMIRQQQSLLLQPQTGGGVGFSKRLFVQYLWRNAKPLEKARVQKEFDPRRQRLLKFVTDPVQRKKVIFV